MRFFKSVTLALVVAIASFGLTLNTIHAGVVLVPSGGGSITDTDGDGINEIFAPFSFDLVYDTSRDLTGGETGIKTYGLRFEIDGVEITGFSQFAFGSAVLSQGFGVIGTASDGARTMDFGFFSTPLVDDDIIMSFTLITNSAAIFSGTDGIDLRIQGSGPGVGQAAVPGLSFFDNQADTSPANFVSADAEASALINPVPIPAALPLFLSGLLGLGVMARRRKQKTVAA